MSSAPPRFFPILEVGGAIIHEGSLKSLPVLEQVQLLAAEKAAREARRGIWEDPELVEVVRSSAGAERR